MIGIVVSAALLGIIIAAMEEGDFPGWGVMIVCVLAASVPTAIVNAFLPDGLVLVGAAVGAVCGGLAISATCGMSVKRASIAAAIYLACQIGLSFVF